jgi:hypothetical protein
MTKNVDAIDVQESKNQNKAFCSMRRFHRHSWSDDYSPVAEKMIAIEFAQKELLGNAYLSPTLIPPTEPM